ncbi:hypothetical protein M514_25689 [Trichuris suis]|uniref:Uncharacterized protein n=1 Tax=Trichuris suis TaxID=68888 RepID=A0A085MXZ1_9BILA|nr:hypothetical protein M514_25689 [Trichuris suis]
MPQSRQDRRRIPACLDVDGCGSSSASVKFERLRKDLLVNCLASRHDFSGRIVPCMRSKCPPVPVNRRDRSRLGSCCSAIVAASSTIESNSLKFFISISALASLFDRSSLVLPGDRSRDRPAH